MTNSLIVRGWGARLLVGLVCLGSSGGCDVLQKIPGSIRQQSEPVPQDASGAAAPSRYQLQKDRNGRVIRLDTVTGQTVIVDPDAKRVRPTPSVNNAPSDAKANSGAGESSTERPTAPETPAAVAEVPSQDDSSRVPAPVTGAIAVFDVCLRRDVFLEAVTLADAPIYIGPRTSQTPLTTLPSALVVVVRERTGDWYLVSFTDPRLGPRVGYAHCSNLRTLNTRPDPS